MNGDYINRCLDEWIAKEAKEVEDQLKVHIKFSSGESLIRLFMGSLRTWWWKFHLEHNKPLIKENRRLQAENELLRKQKRNLQDKVRLS